MPSRRDSFVEPEPRLESAAAGDRRADEPDPHVVRAVAAYLAVLLVLVLGVATAVVAAVYTPTRQGLSEASARAEAGAAVIVPAVPPAEVPPLLQVEGASAVPVLPSTGSGVPVIAADADGLVGVLPAVEPLVDPRSLAATLAGEAPGLAVPSDAERLVFALQGTDAAVESAWIVDGSGLAARVEAEDGTLTVPAGARGVVAFDVAVRTAEPTALADAVFGVTAESGSVLQGLGGTERWALVASTVTDTEGLLRGRIVPDATPEVPVVVAAEAASRLGVAAGDTLTVDLAGSRATGRVADVVPVVPGGAEVMADLAAAHGAIAATGGAVPTAYEVWADGDDAALDRLGALAPSAVERSAESATGDAGPFATGLWLAAIVLLLAGGVGAAALGLSPPTALRGFALGRGAAAPLLGAVAPPVLLVVGGILVGGLLGTAVALGAVPGWVRWGVPGFPPEADVMLRFDAAPLLLVLGVLLAGTAVVAFRVAREVRRRESDAGPRRTGEIPIIPSPAPASRVLAPPTAAAPPPQESLGAEAPQQKAPSTDAPLPQASAPEAAPSAQEPGAADPPRRRGSHRAPGQPDTGPVPRQRRAAHRAPGDPDTGPIPRQDDRA
ncbi:hypothetical protein [Desertivibrio insolitus]|uniref:hypothetical protein n=1 Tax=Herbiconiux sp. SYSU D00978 TaxID=2812562 RepID=UPI001A96D413|nr:hypothetical protein [Herbiconiux sp. SYSU D00978]